MSAGGREHQEEPVQAALHVGRGLPPQEAVRAGCPGQRSGPGMAHQAAAAAHQRHPRQPQVPEAGAPTLTWSVVSSGLEQEVVVMATAALLKMDQTAVYEYF